MTTVLVAEDDADVRTLISMVLDRAGLTAITVPSGTAALEVARTAVLDAALLDVRMPGTSGVDVCRVLRTEGATRDLPILLLTGAASDEDVILGMEAGADDYVIKPFSPRELATRLWTVLARRSPQTVGAGFSAGMLASVALCANPRPVTLTSALGVASVASRAAGRHIA
jgi:two-component system, OmpR family, phosphate regulon response regulator PhoB